MIWTSPLLDYNKTVATNQFSLPTLTYFMQTQVRPMANLQRLDLETRKIMVENETKHPSHKAPPRSSLGRGLKSVEAKYKITKIKAALNCNTGYK